MRLRYRYFFFASVVIWLSSCSLFSKNKEADVILPNPLVEIETLVEITKLWSQKIGRGYTENYLNLAPTYAMGNLFVSDYKGHLACLEATSGTVLWRVDTDVAITSGPGAGESLVLIGSGEGDVFAYDKENGEFVWQSKVSSEVLVAPQEAKGVAVVRTIDGNVFGLDADDGSRLWTYNRAVPALTLRGTSRPLIVGDLVIAGSDGGYLAAIDLLSGKLIWEISVALSSGRSQLDRLVDIDSTPVAVENDVYAVSFQGRVVAVELESGREIWGEKISSYSGLTADDDAVYVTDDQSDVWALDRQTGEVLWTQEELYARMVTMPAVINGFIVVGDLEGYLHWLDKESGLFQARTRVAKDALLVPPLAVEDIVYTYNSKGVLSAYTYQ